MEDKNIVEEVRKFVKGECEKPNARYPTAYNFHFKSMHNIAKKMAMDFGADVEVVEIATWLHDIGSVMEGRENHHITGAKIAENKLRELGYPEDKIKQVKECILNHRGSKESQNKRLSIEAKIISEADALDSFNDVSKQFLITLVHEKLNLEDAKKSVINKLRNKWDQLEFDYSKKLVKPKFDAVMLLVEEGVLEKEKDGR